MLTSALAPPPAFGVPAAATPPATLLPASLAPPAPPPATSPPPAFAVEHASPSVSTSASPSASPSSFVTLQADCSLPFKEAKERLLEEFEAAYVRRLLAVSDGTASELARLAGIDRKHLYTLAKKHNLDRKARGD
jgi:DNA-binding NtrC family response regulator